MYDVWEYDLRERGSQGYIIAEEVTLEQAKILIRNAPDNILRVITRSGFES